MSSAVQVIRPAKRRLRLSEIWTTRRVAWILAQREFKIRYKQSLLGPPWLILQPLGILAALLFVFHGVTSVNTGDVSYVVFALIGMAAWTFIQTALANGATVIAANASLIRRVQFPRTAFYTAMLLSAAVGPVVVLFAALVAIVVSGVDLSAKALLFPLWIVWLIVFMAGALFIAASLAGRYRDAIAIIPLWSQAGLFLTPVGYQVGSAPPTIRTILDLNPLTGIIELWRWSLIGTSVESLAIVSAIVGTVLITVGGWQLYTRMEPRFADFV
jgi:lipopolysaccharide transport system permease protein